MQWMVRLETTASAGQVRTTEPVTLNRPAVIGTLVEVGPALAESKARLAKLPASMLCSHLAEDAAHHRGHAASGMLRPLKDRRTPRLQALLGTVEVKPPWLKLCRCRQPVPLAGAT